MNGDWEAAKSPCRSCGGGHITRTIVGGTEKGTELVITTCATCEARRGTHTRKAKGKKA